MATEGVAPVLSSSPATSTTSIAKKFSVNACEFSPSLSACSNRSFSMTRFSLQPKSAPQHGPHSKHVPSPSPPRQAHHPYQARASTGGPTVVMYSLPVQHMSHPDAKPLFFPAPESAANSYKALPSTNEEIVVPAPIEYGFDPFAESVKSRTSSARPKSNRKPHRSASKSFSTSAGPNSPPMGSHANWRENQSQSRPRALSRAKHPHTPGSPGLLSHGPRRGRTPMLSPMMTPMFGQSEAQGGIPSFSLDGGNKRHVGFQSQEQDGTKDKKSHDHHKHGHSRASSNATARSSSRSTKFAKSPEKSENKTERPVKMVDADGWELVVNKKKTKK